MGIPSGKKAAFRAPVVCGERPDLSVTMLSLSVCFGLAAPQAAVELHCEAKGAVGRAQILTKDQTSVISERWRTLQWQQQLRFARRK